MDIFSVAENLEILELYRHLRVSDVRDGMDWVGYHHYGTVHPSIRARFPSKKTAVGIARTARYVPYEGPVPHLSPDEYTEWVLWYYDQVCPDPFRERKVRDGDFICYDIAGLNVGVIGSNCTLEYIKSGVRGFVLNGGGVRDSDECNLEGIPVWSKFTSQAMDQARIRLADTDVSIAIGGVAIYPGDVIVADGDGVIAVPRKIARDVAKYAKREAVADKKTRKQLYTELGMSFDDTLEFD